MLRSPKTWLVAAGAAMALTLSACGSDDSPNASSAEFEAGTKMAEIAKAGKLKVGTLATYPLLGQQTLDGYSGFDIEIAKGIAKRLGLTEKQVEFTPVTTPTREAFLQQGTVDLITAGYVMTPERDKVIDFAGPYLQSPSGLMVKTDSTITGFDSLNGKKLCAAAGSTHEEFVKATYPDIKLTLFDSSAKCRDAVLNGQVDASTTERSVLSSFVSESDDKLKVLDDVSYLDDNYYGIGVQQTDDRVFCEWINDQLTDMFENGEWVEAWDKTMGTVLGAAPTPPTVRSCDKATSE